MLTFPTVQPPTGSKTGLVCLWSLCSPWPLRIGGQRTTGRYTQVKGDHSLLRMPKPWTPTEHGSGARSRRQGGWRCKLYQLRELIYMTTGGLLPFFRRSLGKYGANSCCCPQLCPHSWGPSVGLSIALLSLQHFVPSDKGQEPVQ